jgi:hypothetical protein
VASILRAFTPSAPVSSNKRLAKRCLCRTSRTPASFFVTSSEHADAVCAPDEVAALRHGAVSTHGLPGLEAQNSSAQRLQALTERQKVAALQEEKHLALRVL